MHALQGSRRLPLLSKPGLSKHAVGCLTACHTPMKAQPHKPTHSVVPALLLQGMLQRVVSKVAPEGGAGKTTAPAATAAAATGGLVGWNRTFFEGHTLQVASIV